MPTPIVYKKTLRILTECENTRDIKRIDGRRHEIFHWRISLHDADETDEMRAASLPWIERVEFLLHETFPNPRRVMNKPPFTLSETGYGSFEMMVAILPRDGKSRPILLRHVLDLEKICYEKLHTLEFAFPSPEFSALLDGDMTKFSRLKESVDLEKETLYGFDVEELLSRLQALQGDSILQAVNIVKTLKTPIAFIDDKDPSEFAFDLYTLSPIAVRALWEFTTAPQH